MRPTDADFREALRGHESRVDRFRRGELSPEEFRPVRLGYGLYYQLDHTSHMQRIKLPGGLLTAAQAECVADIGDRLGRGIIHVTTRQDVQLHWIPLDQIIGMYEALHAVGITTRGACADSVRNVTGCIHGGIAPDEPFDVTPYVWAAHEYFLFHPLNLTLPRKFKIAFAGCAADCAQGVINDIGFYACRVDGRDGFRVFAGGGLGAQPFLARPVRDFLPVADTLIMSEAIVRVQHRLGERKNRSRARMKYVIKKLGFERFRAAVDAEFARVEAESGAALRAELEEICRGFTQPEPTRPAAAAAPPVDEAFAHWTRTNTGAQKQRGYYWVMVNVPFGDVSSDQLRAVAAISREFGNGVMRASNDQNLLIPWISGADLRQVYDRLLAIDLGRPDALHISDVVSCPGADFCSLAVSRSMGVAARIRAHFATSNGAIEELGEFRIRISGCPNSCGQHHVGDIGLTGMTVKGADGIDRPHYSVLLGGAVGADSHGLGQRLPGKYAEGDVPKLIAGLADCYRRQRHAGESFRAFVHRVGMAPLTEAAQQTGVQRH